MPQCGNIIIIQFYNHKTLSLQDIYPPTPFPHSYIVATTQLATKDIENRATQGTSPTPAYSTKTQLTTKDIPCGVAIKRHTRRGYKKIYPAWLYE